MEHAGAAQKLINDVGSTNKRWDKLRPGLPHMWNYWATLLRKKPPITHIRVLICRVDDPTRDTITELAASISLKLISACSNPRLHSTIGKLPPT